MLPVKHSLYRHFLALLITLFTFIVLPVMSISAGESSSREVTLQDNLYADAEITTGIIPGANETFGYDVLLYGRPLVHQPI